jgi:hypothetical protein
MPIQAFVDESGSDKHFLMVGLVGHSENWKEFSEEWAFCLKQPPAISLFKMKEAANYGGQFYGVDPTMRDAKLRSLARIINKHARIVTWSIINLEAHSETWARMPKPHCDPYFWPFQNSIMAVCYTLWDAGWRERFEIIFDEHRIWGPRARVWYPIIRENLELREPGPGTIMPIDPMFKTDNEFLPIQAADLFAWCIRKATDKQGENGFEWLLAELKNVKTTDYSQYYDLDRMKAVMVDSVRMVREEKQSDERLKRYSQIRSIAFPKG